MREFFGGWKRKLGVVTLLLACVFAAGWVRSTRIADQLSLGHEEKSVSAWSMDQEFDIHAYGNPGVIWLVRAITGGYFDLGRNDWTRGAAEPAPQTQIPSWIDVASDLSGIYWQIEFPFPEKPTYSDLNVIVRYRTIVLPLTLLSAYLLLSKPRQEPAMVPE